MEESVLEFPSRKPDPRSKRYRVRLQVHYWAAGIDGRGFTRNVSDSGLLIETAGTAEVGQRLHLEVFAPDDHYFAEGVIARRARAHPTARPVRTPAIGVRFLRLGEALTLNIGAFEVDLRDPKALEEAYERDIKHGGIRVPSLALHEVGEEVVVPLVLPPPHGKIECRATVVRIYDDPQGVAVKLIDVDAARARILEILRPR